MGTPVLAGIAEFNLVSGRSEVHHYEVAGFQRNEHGLILNVTWDNGVESTYYLGKDKDLLVDDGSSGTWNYIESSNSLVLWVENVGVFRFNLDTEPSFIATRYYWDAPITMCRDELTGRPVADSLCFK